VGVIALTAHAGIATSQVVAGSHVVPDQQQRQSAYATSSAAAFDVEQARISWGAGALAGPTLDQSTREAIQARWLARYGGTQRTCVLLCGGR